MALAPEFFIVLGIDIFLAESIICYLLERQLSPILQYLFQGAAIAGLADLLLGQGQLPSTRVWAGIIYLAFALSSLVSVNIRLAIVRRRMSLAPIFSSMLTVPVVMISALFLFSFLQNGGELVFSLASIATIVTLVAVANVSIFGLLREFTRGGIIRGASPLSLAATSALETMGDSQPDFMPSKPSLQEELWAESRKKDKD